MSGWLLALTRITLIGCGLVGGALFVFSVMVMPALRRLRPADGIAAMQSINDVAQRSPLFLGAFVGTGALSAALAISTAWTWDEPGAGYRLAGGLLYLAGCFGLTIAYHVPRNDALARLDPHTPAAHEAWTRYLAEWVPANHIRALAATAAVVDLLLALAA